MPARLLIACLCLACLAAAQPVRADTGQDAELLPAHALELGYQVVDFQYKESGLMEETGVLHGVFGRWTGFFAEQFMLRAEAEYSGGELDYDGHYQDKTPATTDTRDRLVTARGAAGWAWVTDSAAFIPYAGLGLRYWNDDIGGPGGYEREISQVFMPLGLEAVCVAVTDWRFTARAEYDLFLGGRVESHLGDADPGYDTLTNDQEAGSGYGVQVSVAAERRLDGWSLGLEPFYRWWDIGGTGSEDLVYNGNVIGTGYEPANETRIWGLRLFMGW